jgi:hypothetical protein
VAAGRVVRALISGLLLATCGACSTRSSTDASKPDALGPAPAPAPDPIAELRPFEEETRRNFDFANPPSAETGLGADPWTIRRVPSQPYWVGILRGRSAIVLLDDELHELARAVAPRSPTGLALGKNGEILVTGELSPVIARFAVRGHALASLGETRVPDVFGLRDVAISPAGVVWALDERNNQLLRVTTGSPAKVTRYPVGHGAAQIVATKKHVIVNAVTEHTLDIFTTDVSGAINQPTPKHITHDGPIWGFDVFETEKAGPGFRGDARQDEMIIVAGGVEDHPLDRKGGFFGFIDSFVYFYRVRDSDRDIHPVFSFNASELGVITPKALSIKNVPEDGTISLLVSGYGSAIALDVALGLGGPLLTKPVTLVPGTRSIERHFSSERHSTTTVMADPLLDAWVALDEDPVDPTHSTTHVVPVANETPRPTPSRLGEALFFTSLMAPKNTSAGALSRFTCETCHFEGYVDGRTHHTGREDIHATTKPLVGLIGNRPHFSRALDPDLSTIAHAEFRVAGAGSNTDPFFAIEPKDHSWVEHVGVHERVEPLDLRRALMRFLSDFSHRPNPAVVARPLATLPANTRGPTFEPSESEGARLFRDRCVSCHAARLSADDPASEIPFDRWESMVLSEAAPIVWGSAGYKKTGVVPYVHPDGARTPSLRRLHKKYPYFTNGSAHSLDAVLDTVRIAGPDTFHGTAPDGAMPLDVATKRALHSFLELL